MINNSVVNKRWLPGLDSQAVALLPVIFSLLLYLPSLFHNFVWDAEIIFRDDPTIREWRFLFSGFTEALFQNIPPDGARLENLQYYRPLVKVLHVVEQQIFGVNPMGYQAVNIMANAAVAGLFYLLVLSVSGSGLAALLASLLYAANPSRVEAVCWSYSDSYLIAALFGLLAMLAWRRGRRIAALVCYFFSLLSHEMAILLPVVIVAHDILIEGKRRVREHLRTGFFFLVAAVFLALRTAVVGAVPLPRMEVTAFLNTGAVVLQRYLKIFFWPDAPVTIYPAELFPAFTTEVAISYLVLAVTMALAVFLWFRWREGLFWLLWFFLWPAVTLNAGRFGEYLMAEKLIYLASGGLCALIARGMLGLAGRWKAVMAALLTVAICLHAGVTYRREAHWRNSRTYLEKAMEHAPRFAPALYTLGLSYAEAGEYGKAQAVFEKAVEARPGFSLAYNNLGNIHLLRGDFRKAIGSWQAALKNDPMNPMPYFNLGMAKLMNKEPQQALLYLEGYLARTQEPDPRAVEQVRRLRAMGLQIPAAPAR